MKLSHLKQSVARLWPMAQIHSSGRRGKRPPRPLDLAALEELALAYAARFATSAAKLENYLRRKLRERGWDGREEGREPPDAAGLVERFVDKGYVDDEGYARARSGDLLRRGYGARRVSQALAQAGIGEDIRQACDPQEQERRNAALTMARKRRFGPFCAAADGTAEESHKRREKQLAAMVRAGHDFTTAKAVIDARNAEEIERWVFEADHEDVR
ncbi:MAG: regulatory protein RecX [Qipengyuania sp.]